MSSDADDTVSVDDIRLDDVEMDSFANEPSQEGYMIEAATDQYDTRERRKAGFRNRLKANRDAKELETVAAQTGMPKIDEWMDFFSRVLIRTATDFAIDMAFRGIDEDLLSDREIDRVRLSDEERHRIAKPMAEFAYKNKFARKHGREILATAGSIDALLQLGVWYTRMSRIAQKYRKIQNGEYVGPPTMRTSRPPETRIPDDIPPVMPERREEPSERSGQSTAKHNGHERGWRPPIAGQQVYSPGG